MLTSSRSVGQFRYVYSIHCIATLVIDLSMPAHSSDHYQLPSTQCYWPSAHNDDALGVGGCFAGRLQCRERVQHCLKNPTTDLDIAQFSHLDTMLLL